MASRAWGQVIKTLTEVYPLRGPADNAGDYPTISEPIDKGAQALLAPLSGPALPTNLNPLEVEGLLDTVGNRLTSCMTYREKAQDLEIRQISAAIDYASQTRILKAASDFAQIESQSEQNLLRSYATLSIDGTEIKGKTPVPADYWTKRSLAQTEQIAALQEALERQKLKSQEDGNGSNLIQRFTFLKKLFNMNLYESYARARAAAEGLNNVYGITLPVPPLTDVGYLNALVLWAQQASDKLDAALDQRYFGTVSLALANSSGALNPTYQLMDKATFISGRNSGLLSFRLRDDHFGALGMNRPRVRGFRLQVAMEPVADSAPQWRYEDNSWPTQVALPDQTLSDGKIVTPQTVVLARYTFNDIDAPPPGIRSVHNASPIGEWQIKLPPTDLSGWSPTNGPYFQNVFLHLRVSYEH